MCPHHIYSELATHRVRIDREPTEKQIDTRAPERIFAEITAVPRLEILINRGRACSGTKEAHPSPRIGGAAHDLVRPHTRFAASAQN